MALLWEPPLAWEVGRRRRGAGLPGASMMGPPPMQSADSNEDAASLHAQISALKVMRRRMKAFRRRKRQRVEEPEDDVSMITAETVKETGASLYSASRIEDRLPPRLLEVCYDACTEGSAGPRAPASL